MPKFKSLTMSRFYLRLILITIALFTVMLLLIHAQPYDDHELHELLLPEGCPAPCFMGIRPGVTTMEEAIKIVAESKWVAKIDNVNLPNEIRWIASSLAPNSINRGQINTVVFSNSIVVAITFGTNFRVGDIRLEFGRPDIEDVTMAGMGLFYYRAVYFDKEMSISVTHPCPQSEITIWDVNTGIAYIQMLSKNFGLDSKRPWGETVTSCRNFNPLAGL